MLIEHRLDRDVKYEVKKWRGHAQGRCSSQSKRAFVEKLAD